LEGEAAGKSSNENWAVQVLILILFIRFLKSLSLIEISILTMLLLQLLMLILYIMKNILNVYYINFVQVNKFRLILDQERHLKIFQAPIFFYNNFLSCPFFTKCMSFLVSSHSLGNFYYNNLANISDPLDHHLPTSTYSISLLLIKRVKGWDTDIITGSFNLILRGLAFVYKNFF
jgi:hypothetical protein